MAKKKLTIDGLAARMEKGFESMAVMVKHGFDGVNKRFDRIEARIVTLEDCVRILQDNVHDTKIAHGPLVRMVAAMEVEHQQVLQRLLRLERKVGIGK